MRPIEEQGYVVVAINNEHTDYVHCAVRLTESLKAYHPNARVCLITDSSSVQDPVFDHVRVLPSIEKNVFANDAAIFKLTPFR